jgi:hypothetical protein
MSGHCLETVPMSGAMDKNFVWQGRGPSCALSPTSLQHIYEAHLGV